MECIVECRYVLIAMISLGFFNITLLRTNISVAIISMVNSTTAIGQDSSNSSSQRCSGANETILPDARKVSGSFKWSSVDQGLVLGCYFYGYVVSSIPGPWIAKRFGFKHVIGVCMALSSIVTIFEPLLAYHSLELFVASRITLGFLQGTIIPTSIAAFPVWVPPNERNVLYPITFIGFAGGAFVTLPLAGVVTENLGWEAVFYVTGSYTLTWSLVWCLLVYDTPSKHPRCSARERKYIQQTLEEENITVQDAKHRRIPWLSILSSPPVWAAIFAHAAYDWTLSIASLLLPTYMSRILKFNVSAAGASAGIPYLIMGFVAVCGGFGGDVILRKRLMSRTNLRKLYVLAGLLIPAFFIVMASHTGCNQALAVLYFVITVSSLGLHVPGTEANYFDLSPIHSGILFGIAGALSTSMGFLAPQIAGHILYPDASLSKWRTVFWITAGLKLAAAMFYLIFASGVEQKWSRLEKEPSESKNTDHLKDLISEDCALEDSGTQNCQA